MVKVRFTCREMATESQSDLSPDFDLATPKP